MTRLDPFTSQAPDWWDEDAGPAVALHKMNPLRMDAVEKHASLTGAAVLDVGCGAGIATEELHRRGADVIGVDANHAMIHAALARPNASAVRYVEGEIPGALEDLGVPEESFDVVTCFELLEHVTTPDALIDSAARYLKPGGILAMSTINRTLRAFLAAIVGAEHVLKIVPRGTHQYDMFLKPSEVAKMCRDAGLSTVETRGMLYLPVIQKAHFVSDHAVNWLGVYRKG